MYEGACMKAQHKTMPDGTGAGKGCIMTKIWKRTLRIRKTGNMESAAERRTTQMAAPTTATVAAPTAMEATYAAATIPTPAAGKQ